MIHVRQLFYKQAHRNCGTACCQLHISYSVLSTNAKGVLVMIMPHASDRTGSSLFDNLPKVSRRTVFLPVDHMRLNTLDPSTPNSS